MNCERFRTVVNDLTRDQNRSPREGSPSGVVVMAAEERARALAHAAECEGCALNLEDERNLTAGLRTLADQMKSLAGPPRLEENVLAAFREQLDVRSVVRPIQAQRQPARYWVAAIAAVLLIVFGIFVVRGRILLRPTPRLAGREVPKTQDSSTVPPRTNDQPSTLATAKDTTPATPPVHTPRRKVNRFLAVTSPSRVGSKYTNAAANAAAAVAADSKNNQKNSEITTGFFPLSYGGTPNLQEGGQLLRIELPRAAVARFGLPVNMERASERVKADVLVGADGLAQAIRFIH